MFNIFKNLFNMSTKQELEQQLTDAIAVAQRLNEENKTLKTQNEELSIENKSLKTNLMQAIEKVRYLDGQVRILEAQRQAKKQFSDNDKNY